MRYTYLLAALLLAAVMAAGCASDAASDTPASAYEERTSPVGKDTQESKETSEEKTSESDSEKTSEGLLTDAPAMSVSDFARKIKRAVAASDIESLADLCGYPVYVSSASGEGGEIETRSELIALGADALFTKELKDTIAAAQESGLESYAAGYMMGENGAVIFNDINGKLVITGINTGN